MSETRKNKIAQLEKEADWLAEMLAARDNLDFHKGCLSCADTNSKAEWRQAAREAVEVRND